MSISLNKSKRMFLFSAFWSFFLNPLSMLISLLAWILMALLYRNWMLLTMQVSAIFRITNSNSRPGKTFRGLVLISPFCSKTRTKSLTLILCSYLAKLGVANLTHLGWNVHGKTYKMITLDFSTFSTVSVRKLMLRSKETTICKVVAYE